MNRKERPAEDGWEQALESLGGAPGDLDLLAEVRQATGRVLHRRRRVRQAGALLGGFLLFVAGFATARLTESEAAPVTPRDDDPTVWAEAPIDLERKADAAEPEERARLLLTAGDRYLDEGGDVTASLRCYRRLLSDDEALACSDSAGSDSWLWLAMKHLGTD